MLSENTMISDVLNRIPLKSIRNDLYDLFNELRHRPVSTKCGALSMSEIMSVTERVLTSASDALKNDASLLYIEVADVLYDLFYRSPLYANASKSSKIKVHLRDMFIQKVLIEQDLELSILFIQEGILPQFYSSKVISEIRNTNFKKLLNSNTSFVDEIIPAAMIATPNDTIPVMVLVILDETFEEFSHTNNAALIKELNDLFTNISDINFVSYFMMEDLVNVQDAIESCITFTFCKESKELPFAFDGEVISDLVYRFFKNGMEEVIDKLRSVYFVSRGSSQYHPEQVFHDLYDNIYRSLSEELEQEEAFYYLENNTNVDIDEFEFEERFIEFLLRLTHLIMGYIVTEFLYNIERRYPKVSEIILTNIIRELLSYRVYEVDPA